MVCATVTSTPGKVSSSFTGGCQLLIECREFLFDQRRLAQLAAQRGGACFIKRQSMEPGASTFAEEVLDRRLD